MDQLPPELSPIVQVIDDWNTCRKLGLAFEAQVGGGRLLFCAVDLEKDLDQRPVARQLRHSLLRYMASDQFDPATAVEPAAIRGLLRPPTWLQETRGHRSGQQPASGL